MRTSWPSRCMTSPRSRQRTSYPFDYCDGPNGVRGHQGATAFPSTLSLAASLDRDLALRYGAALDQEVLTGRTEPGGRLPMTFAADESATPIQDREQYPGVMALRLTPKNSSLATAGITIGVPSPRTHSGMSWATLMIFRSK